MTSQSFALYNTGVWSTGAAATLLGAEALPGWVLEVAAEERLASAVHIDLVQWADEYAERIEILRLLLPQEGSRRGHGSVLR